MAAESLSDVDAPRVESRPASIRAVLDALWIEFNQLGGNNRTCIASALPPVFPGSAGLIMMLLSRPN
ncbi:hypothetical protein J2Z31_003030 [Sinorhizobium kostiense]|uniref:Uncharacterized protein n=1 Tax=Sinorhizobium kostiense TaxID=76747 RepID=A0ABS4R296_9HYPH|nr:hypothetical protein [Sinorhizobium kostiense]